MPRSRYQLPKNTRSSRGAILVFSTFALAVVLSMMALAAETFRISAASSQQYDAATLASETAVAAAYKCMHGTSPQRTLSECQEYARTAATAAVTNSRLAGQARVGNIAVDLYACTMYSDSNYETKIITLSPSTLATTQSMDCDKVSSGTSITGKQLRAVQVSISGAQLPTFFKIFPNAQTKFNRGLAQVMYAPDGSALADPNKLDESPGQSGYNRPPVHAVRRVKPVIVEGKWKMSAGN